MNISIGNDHAATAYKFAIVKLLESKGILVKNYGTDLNESVDYPDFVHPVAKDIVSNNNANILCIPARYTSIPQALKMVKTFLNTNFEGGRHQNRVNKIPVC